MLSRPKEIESSNFWICTRRVRDEVIKFDTFNPYVDAIFYRVTNNIGMVDVEHHKREYGQSGYTFKKLFNLWLNGITTFSIKPLRLANFLGMLFAFIGFVVIIFLVISKLSNPSVSVGWTSTVASILLIGGIQMMLLGMIGEYIGRIYLCLNKTPQYVERTVIGKNKDIASQ
jgi:undecaprenyl-phosphate 4-deoxy-4-formamido-L-arabinose transferase